MFLKKVKSKKDFIQNKAREKHTKPPYFSQMEEYNLNKYEDENRTLGSRNCKSHCAFICSKR